jgi:small subunit ribosomal protein S1
MEGKEGSGQPSVEDSLWWTTPDEEYWQALLEQGRIAPEDTHSSSPQEFFFPQTAGSQGYPTGFHARSDENDQTHSDDEWQLARRAFDEGETFRLTVSGVNRGGLLVQWNGLQGFVPASQLVEIPQDRGPQGRMSALSQRIGDALTLRLIEVDEGLNRLVLSERTAGSGSETPDAILGSLSPGEVCRGTVTNLTSFGAFVDLGGVEGLIHISEISWDRVRHPSDVLRPGQEVDVHVLAVQPEERRVALSLKRLRPNPWTRVEARYQVGQVIEGMVTNVVSFGAFVRVEEGLEGLIHVSELAEGSFFHPRNVVREGDEVRVRVLNVDTANRRLGLSLRQVHDDSLAG